MTEDTCPSLKELGIEPGSFIRKLDNKLIGMPSLIKRIY
jgi:hypothetical protein